MELAIAMFLLPAGGGSSWPFGLVVAVAALTMFAGSVQGIRRHVRAVAVLSALLVAAALIETALWLTPEKRFDDHMLYGELSLVVFAVITAVPLIPLQTCVLGSAIGVLYGTTGVMAGGWDGRLQIFIVFLTCFATGLSALLYAQKRAAFTAHEQSLEIQETLSSAQSRAQLAETAISLGRLAAALTHEINTPLGALRSAVDTMMRLSAKRDEARPEDKERLTAAQADLSRSIADSAERLSTVVARLKRLIALERDEKQPVDVKDLLADVGLMVADKVRDGIRLEWNMGDVPAISGSTNQLTTVFANLVSNALSAIDGAGKVTIASTAGNGFVRVSVQDDGRGMDPEDAASAFDPGFKVEHGRVLGGNWSLFTARQIVNEHGGDIWLESQRGKGTTAWVSLPALSSPHPNGSRG